MPVWLLTVLFAALFGALGVSGIFLYRTLSAGAGPLRSVGSHPGGARAELSATLSPEVLLKFLEVTGLRLMEDDGRRIQLQFLVVNHSQAPLTDVGGTIALRPSTAEPGAETLGTVAFRIPSLGPYASCELRAPLETKLRVYELPDWQYLRADLAITSPQLPK